MWIFDLEQDNRWRSLNQQRNDPSTLEQLGSENLGVGDGDDDIDNQAHEDVKEAAVPNIPPNDRSANTPEKAYLLDEIMPKAERAYLLDILENLQSGEDLASKSYPTFVYNRIHKLREIQVNFFDLIFTTSYNFFLIIITFLKNYLLANLIIKYFLCCFTIS